MKSKIFVMTIICCAISLNIVKAQKVNYSIEVEYRKLFDQYDVIVELSDGPGKLEYQIYDTIPYINQLYTSDIVSKHKYKFKDIPKGNYFLRIKTEDSREYGGSFSVPSDN